MPDVDWVARFRESFRAFDAGGFRIVPAVGAGAARATGAGSLVDPGQAFGTGTHESTRLCLAALEAAVRGARAPAACSTWARAAGILAIAARPARGATLAVGIEIDPEALVPAARARRLNDVDVQFVRGDGGGARPRGRVRPGARQHLPRRS